MNNINVDQHVSKPLNWYTNIHHAAAEGKTSSIKYSLSLFPELINLPDKRRQTMAHHAAYNNHKNILIYFHENGADFNIFDLEGNLPINYISKKITHLRNE